MQPNVRLCAAWAESKKPKVWLKIRLQKIEDRDYVRVSSYPRMLLFVIVLLKCSPHEFYSQESNGWCSFSNTLKYEMSSLADCSLLILFARKRWNHETILSLNRWSTLTSRIYGADQKNLRQNFNESCARDWKCKLMNNYIVSTRNIYSHKFHSDRQAKLETPNSDV